MENVPSNSHLKFHFLIPLINLDYIINNQWGGDNAIVFLKFTDNADIANIGDKISEMVYERNPFWKDLKISFKLQPLFDIYLSDYKFDYAEEKGSTKHIFIFGITAFLVLLIACINFTNLFVASSLKRKRFVGIKLTNGANKAHVIKESLFEVVFYLALSFTVAIVIIKLVQPYFNSLAGKDIVIQVFSLKFLALSLPIILISLVLSSIFPWLHLKQLSPIRILKEKHSNHRNKFGIQKVLVTLQFIIAIILIFNVLTISKQLNFLKNKQIGFETENIVYVHTDGKLQEKAVQERMKNELLQNSNILNIAFRGSVPTLWNSGNPLSAKPEFKELMATEEIFVDEDYFDLMQIKFIEGENIYKQGTGTDNFCIINEIAAARLGLEPPYVNQVVYQDVNKPLTIKGVIENINTKSLTQLIDPCIYTYANRSGKAGIMLCKISGNYTEALDAVKSFCQETIPNVPFEYHFLSEDYERLYSSENSAKAIMLVLTSLAIVITCLGLLAMVLFITESRIKEIGIRKTNGARIIEIIALLGSEFIKWVAIAFIIGCPIAWFAMNKWLENFAYKTPMSWWIFISAGLITLVIALITVSWQSWRAATRNPVEALRYE